MVKNMSVVLLSSFIASTFIFVACSGGGEKELLPEEGVERVPCTMNSSCPQGNKCLQGWCEDIYYPKRAIDAR